LDGPWDNVGVSRPRWTPVDVALLALALASPVALVAVRALWLGPMLWDALGPFEYSDARVPRLAMLGAYAYTIWAGAFLAFAFALAGALLRSRRRRPGRVVLLLAPLVVVAAIGVELSGIAAARAADPTDFGVAGVTRCPCPDDLITLETIVCGCDGQDRLVVILADRDLDDRPETRCACDPPAPMRGCDPRCEPGEPMW
jgi:hypothetical protein